MAEPQVHASLSPDGIGCYCLCLFGRPGPECGPLPGARGATPDHERRREDAQFRSFGRTGKVEEHNVC
eukprot:3048962-Amphidinium_carterae.1